MMYSAKGLARSYQNERWSGVLDMCVDGWIDG